MNVLGHWIEQERVMCLCGRIATGTTPGGVPECDNPDCSWAENFERDHPTITAGAVPGVVAWLREQATGERTEDPGSDQLERESNESLLRDGLEARADAEVAQRQLQGA